MKVQEPLAVNSLPSHCLTGYKLAAGDSTRNSRARQGAPKAKFDAVYTSTEFDYLGFGLLLTTGS